jgi:hypothetical protein
MSELTLRELDEAGEMLGQPITEIIGGPRQVRAMAAMAAVVKRRSDPTFTFEQALDLRMEDLEIVEPAPEGNGDGGGAPRPSPEHGTSTP